MNVEDRKRMVMKATAELSARLGMPAPSVYFHNDSPILLGRAWGRCNYTQHAFVITVRGRNPSRIRHTVAHELIHLRFPKLQHGVRFEQYVTSLLRGMLFFDAHGLVTKFPKLKAPKEKIITDLYLRRKRLLTKIKLLTTLSKKVERKIKRLEKSG